MNIKTLIPIIIVAFGLGAATTIAIRGAGGEAASPPAPTATGVDGQEVDHSQHAAGSVDHSQHSPEEHAKHIAGSKAAEGMTRVYVCEQDPNIGLSYAGECPLDGKPMVEREVDLSTFHDVGNDTCPIMGGATREDVFALYQGQKVRFCCPGCGEGFFEKPEEHLKEMGVTLAPHAGHANPDAKNMTEIYVCEQDPNIGLSYAGECPLDGKPMVKRNVDLSEVEDLANATCPIMGGDAREDVFAVYQGKKVRFCCPGCGEGFFEKPEEHIRALGGEH